MIEYFDQIQNQYNINDSTYNSVIDIEGRMSNENSSLLLVDTAIEALKMGGILIYPTDTIWGIGCDPENKSAVERIFQIKKRDRDKPFILLVSDIEMLKRYVYIHPRIETLLVVHQKPLTLIYSEVKNLPDHLLGPDGSIGIRICKHPFTNDLISRYNKPLVSTSANFSGDPFPASFDDINPKLLRLMDHVVRPQLKERNGSPSVVATFNHKGELSFLRL